MSAATSNGGSANRARVEGGTGKVPGASYALGGGFLKMSSRGRARYITALQHNAAMPIPLVQADTFSQPNAISPSPTTSSRPAGSNGVAVDPRNCQNRSWRVKAVRNVEVMISMPTTTHKPRPMPRARSKASRRKNSSSRGNLPGRHGGQYVQALRCGKPEALWQACKTAHPNPAGGLTRLPTCHYLAPAEG